jgi:hypothetical protein
MTTDNPVSQSPVAEPPGQSDEAMQKFRNSVGFQFGFVLYSGLDVKTAVDHVCSAAEKLVEARVNPASSITEKAQRVVDLFNEWLVTDFEPGLTQDQAEALQRIITAEFGADAAPPSTRSTRSTRPSQPRST